MKARFGVLAIALLLLALIPATVTAKKPETPPANAATTTATSAVTTRTATGAKGKVTLCHRTGSAKKPWVKVVVGANARKAHEKHGDFVLAAGASCPTTRSTSTRSKTSTTLSSTSTTSVVTSVTTTSATP